MTKSKWTAPEDYEIGPATPWLDPAKHTNGVRGGRAVLNIAGIVAALQHSKVDDWLIQTIANRLKDFASARVTARANASALSEISAKGVPMDGAKAFASAWRENANPWPKDAPEHLEWIAAWWTANAAAYRSDIEGK